jgi:hypothetical protein
LRLRPALASTAEVNRFAQAVDGARVRRSRGIAAQSTAIKRLSQSVAANTKSLAQAQLRGDRKIAKLLLKGDSKVDARISKEVSKQQADVKKQFKWENELVRRSRTRDLWDCLVVASSAPLFAAYGQRGSPFKPNNLTLAASLAVWLVGDEFTELLSGSRDGLPNYARDTDIWSYIAPPANLITGWWLMRNRQHERLISGIAPEFEFTRSQLVWVSGKPFRMDTHVAMIDLSPFVASDHVEDFVTFSAVPAVATVASVEWDTTTNKKIRPWISALRASLDRGVLTITVITTVDGDGLADRARGALSVGAAAVTPAEGSSDSPPSSTTPGSEGPKPVELPLDAPLFTSLNVVWVADTQEP